MSRLSLENQRMQITHKKGDKIICCSINEFESLIKSGQITDDTIVFNNMVSTKKELDTNWQAPLKNSWHAKFLA